MPASSIAFRNVKVIRSASTNISHVETRNKKGKSKKHITEFKHWKISMWLEFPKQKLLVMPATALLPQLSQSKVDCGQE